MVAFAVFTGLRHAFVGVAEVRLLVAVADLRNCYESTEHGRGLGKVLALPPLSSHRTDRLLVRRLERGRQACLGSMPASCGEVAVGSRDGLRPLVTRLPWPRPVMLHVPGAQAAHADEIDDVVKKLLDVSYPFPKEIDWIFCIFAKLPTQHPLSVMKAVNKMIAVGAAMYAMVMKAGGEVHQNRHRLNGYLAQRVPSLFLGSSSRNCLNYVVPRDVSLKD